MTPSLLIIEDEESLRKALERFFRGRDFEVQVTPSGEEGLKVLRQRAFDLLLVDLMLPKVSGIEILKKAREMQASLVTIVMTGYGTIPSAIEAIKAGAFHYVTKPFELEDLFSLVTKGIENRRLKEENKALRQALRDKFSLENLVGTSPRMQEVAELVNRVAPTDSTVLILGESGTGKELLAKALHYRSRRADRPLVTVNCAAIPETLLESELFGHLKGSFTGAVSNQQGRFEAADGGTIFLDEIGDMSPRLQVKFLRVLQERTFEPIGSTKSREVDVRILAATNRDLQQEVKGGTFREDLFYRLNVIPITIPPLRDRKEDIPLLVQHFLEKSNEANRKGVAGLSPDIMGRLLAHNWPGNVRELENLVERIVVLKGSGTIEAADLPSFFSIQEGPDLLFQAVSIPDAGVSFRDLTNKFEEVLIRRALEKCGGNRNKAALLLGINRTTLLEKLKKKEFQDLALAKDDA